MGRIRLEWTVEAQAGGRSGLGAGPRGGRLGSGAGLRGGSGVPPTLPGINVVICGRPSTRETRRAQETPAAQKSLWKIQRETKVARDLGLSRLLLLSSLGPVT